MLVTLAGITTLVRLEQPLNASVPMLVTPSGITTLARLASIVIPESVKSIGNEAFWGCKGLASVVIPKGVTCIGWKAFAGCSSLTSVVIPKGVKSINYRAFEGCSSLTSVVIPASVTSIGNWTFEGCCGLKPENAPSISVSVFSAMRLGIQAGYGFLSARERFTNPEIAGGYLKYCISQRKKILPLIFRDDNAEALRFYIDEKKVTAKNFDTDYFVPALQAGAEKCKALLLEWKEQH